MLCIKIIGLATLLSVKNTRGAQQYFTYQTSRGPETHRRRIKTEEKANVVAAVWGRN